MSLSNTRKRKREPQQKQHKKIKLTSNSKSTTSSTLRARTTLCNLDIPSTHRSNESHPNHEMNVKHPNNHNANHDSHCFIPLSVSEIEACCHSKCNAFTAYIYHTNAHSLHNILTLQHQLQLENLTCCIANCTHSNDGAFYLCLRCVFYCCSHSQHFTSHCKQHAHYLYFELSSQSVYCAKCGDYHHSPWTDSMILHFIGLAHKRVSQPHSKHKHGSMDCKPVEIKSMNDSIWSKFDCIRDSGMLGIRGVYNLGSTCYMTVILQIFAHNDRLRNYYLSCSHSCKCNAKKNCISCEVEQLFCHFYCGINGASVAISNFLGSTWRDDAYNLAGQEMHDCHELFISVTNLLHKTSPNKHKLDDEKLCKCIVHSTFRGLFCSELKCANCRYVSQTVASFMEINLQIKKMKNAQQINNKTIEEALRDYMESEPMPDYKCTNCGKKQCNKDMTIHTLPQTLCLHLKRFEADELLLKELSASANSNHNMSQTLSPSVVSIRSKSRSRSPSVTKQTRSRRKNAYKYEYNKNHNNNSNGSGKYLNDGSNGNDNTFGKIDDFIEFPVNEILDLSTFVNVKRKANKVNNKKYKLQSMIVHTGGVIASGHYLCYVRKDNCWFQLDDVSVHPVIPETVRMEKAYMLFYEAQ